MVLYSPHLHIILEHSCQQDYSSILAPHGTVLTSSLYNAGTQLPTRLFKPSCPTWFCTHLIFMLYWNTAAKKTTPTILPHMVLYSPHLHIILEHSCQENYSSHLAPHGTILASSLYNAGTQLPTRLFKPSCPTWYCTHLIFI